RPDRLVANECRQHADHRHRRRDLPVAAPFELRLEELERRRLERVGLRTPHRNESSEPFTTLEQVALLLAALGELAERDLRDLLVGDRDVEAVPERFEIVLVELLLLMRDVAGFA